MRFFSELFSNRCLLVAAVAWIAAQALKVVFYYLVEKKWDLSRMFGLGGMPSSHSAVVSGLAVSVGIARGFYSVEFAITFVLACVVMTDAAGVRRAAGKQAATINRLVREMFEGGGAPTYETLKEFLGHSPFEVLVGSLLGILLAAIMM